MNVSRWSVTIFEKILLFGLGRKETYIYLVWFISKICIYSLNVSRSTVLLLRDILNKDLICLIWGLLNYFVLEYVQKQTFSQSSKHK